jgi:hypothetical protein
LKEGDITFVEGACEHTENVCKPCEEFGNNPDDRSVSQKFTLISQENGSYKFNSRGNKRIIK